jgi:hypothetical protein
MSVEAVIVKYVLFHFSQTWGKFLPQVSHFSKFS